MDRKYLFWNMLSRSFDFFFKNFKELFALMLTPIAVQLVGIVLALFPSLYLVNVKQLSAEDMVSYILPIIICLVVGIFLYCWGFWKYLLLSCYFTLGANDYDETKNFYLEIYKNNIKQREKQYIKTLLWPALYMLLIFAVCMAVILYCSIIKTKLTLIICALTILLMVVALTVFSLKISLLLPIFTLEPDVKPLDVMKKSIDMTKGSRIFTVFGLLFIIWLVSVVLQIVVSILVSIFGRFFISGTTLARCADVISGFSAMFLLPLNVSAMTFLYKRFISK